MASPSVFISSTCYDLQEIRNTLREFIIDFGFDPVMSEFGDVFYEFNVHTQDACLSEIEKCNIFILIIGNNYGSFYHRELEEAVVPDSITLKEFQKALSINIPKHIFINRFVHYDYQNFKKSLNDNIKQYFGKHDVPDKDIVKTVKKLRREWDATYPFPCLSYRYIFHFIDLIDDLKINNAVFPFETFINIKDMLRKQWAGYMYERLTSTQNVPLKLAEKYFSKIDNLEKIIQKLLTTKSEQEGHISIDINEVSGNIAYSQLEKAQEVLEQSLNIIMINEYGEDRGELIGYIDKENILKWLESLDAVISTYKWAKTIPFEKILSYFKCRFYTRRDREVPLAEIIKLNGLFKNLPKKEYDSFAETILLKLGPYIKPDEESTELEPF